jgi:hypothetical protein
MVEVDRGARCGGNRVADFAKEKAMVKREHVQGTRRYAKAPASAPAQRRKKTPGDSGAARMAQETEVAPGERERMVAEAAYFIAERRRFAAGDALSDWLQAEAEIDARLRSRRRH